MGDVTCFFRFHCAIEDCRSACEHYSPLLEEDKGVYFGGYDRDGNNIDDTIFTRLYGRL